MTEVQVALFDVNKLKNKKRGQNILIIGKGKSGKTTLVNNLISQIETSSSNTKVFTENFDDQVLQELMATYVNNVRAGNQQKLTIVFDNINNITDRNIAKLTLMNSRRLGITCIITANQIIVKEELKPLIDYVFIFGESDTKKLEEIYENYLYMVPYNLYEPIFTSCTTNYSAVVVDNTVKTNIIQDQVFWYRV